MMKQKTGFLLTLLSFFSLGLQAQELDLHGKVVDTDEEPVVGITVQIDGTLRATATDAEGHFHLHDLPETTETITISGIGYKSKQFAVDPNNSIKQEATYQVEEDVLGLEQVVVTASRHEGSRKEAPVVVRITNQRMMEATQAVSLVEGLSFQPGLFVENNCQNCGFTGVRMNGLETAYTQILIDGRPLFSSLNAVYGLEQIPTNMIERIEVVRGGGSALYGGNAIAGTINVITTEPKQNDVEFSTNQAVNDDGAMDQTYSFGGNFVSKDYRTGVSIQGFHRDRDHWDADGDGFSEMGELNATALNLKAFHTPTDRSKITVNGGYTYEDRRGGNKFELQPHETDITEMTTHNLKMGGISYEQFSANRKHKVSMYFSGQSTDRDSYYGANMDPDAYGTTKANSYVAGAQYVANAEKFLKGSAIFTAGFEYLNESLKDEMPGYNRSIDQRIDQFGFYGQGDFKLSRMVNMNFGLRLDKHSNVEDLIVNPRASILFKATEDLQFRLGYAKGFRGPQVFDEDLHITAVGGEMQIIQNSPDLRPEYSNSYTFSTEYSNTWGAHELSIGLDAFYTDHNNAFILEAVGRDEQNNMILERRNGGGAHVAGLSLTPEYAYSDKFMVQAGFTYQQSLYDEAVYWSEDETIAPESRFLRTPDWYGFYTISWFPTKGLTLNLSGTYTGEMLVGHYAGYIEQDQLEEVPAFFSHNVKVAYDLPIKAFNLQLQGGIQNYTNAFQEDFDQGVDRDAGYIYGPLKPRTYFLGLKFNM